MAAERLAACTRPHLIGVRHHSPHVAAALPALLDAAQPDRLFVELPADLQHWVPWLAHPELSAPVALAAVSADGEQLGFWPFADFSPELAALRWAHAHDVPVEAFDLPVAARAVPDALDDDAIVTAGPTLVDALLATVGSRHVGELWDDLVEGRAPGAPAEAVRRAGLVVGWALRTSAMGPGGDGISPHDLAREAFMRARLAATDAERPVAVVGAFHAAALLGSHDPATDNPATETMRVGDGAKPAQANTSAGPAPVTSLIPYGFELFDSRSGYPAGVLDPAWQQRVWATGGRPDAVVGAAAEALTALCAELRRAGHVAGVPDARETLRMALDLAQLRDLRAPGRRELLEAVATCLGQGERLGRRRALAAAAEVVLVGDHHGRLAPATPRSGLAPHIDDLCRELGLPEAGPTSAPPTDLRLDVTRSRIDRRRHVTLARFAAAGITYAREQDVAGVGGATALGRRWLVRWEPATGAGVAFAGTRGATLAAAAEGTLRLRLARAVADGGPDPASTVALATVAAEAGLARFTTDLLDRLAGPFITEAGFADLLAAHTLVHRMRAGEVPGLRTEAGPGRHPSDPQLLVVPASLDGAPLLGAAVAAVEGLAGSDDRSEVVALADLLTALDLDPAAAGLGRARLRFTLGRFAAGEASPLVQGAATAALVLLADDRDADGGTGLGRMAAAVGSWIDDGTDPGRTAARLHGLLLLAAPLLEAAPAALDVLAERVEALDDDAFTTRVPALRHGFEGLSPAARFRFLAAVAERLGTDADEVARATTLDVDPAVLATGLLADRAGRAAVVALDPTLMPSTPIEADVADASQPRSWSAAAASSATRPHRIGPLDRWRLVLGRQREQLAFALGPLARALDELYGQGHGEGSREGFGGRAGGQEAPYPSARVWGDELEALFGTQVRDEVLGRAAGAGRSDVLGALDPATVTPSVGLLEQVLALRGAVGEAQLTRLRALARAITEALAKELAQQLRPALRGLVTPRPTRRPGGPVDLRRTIAANLHTARPDDTGTLRLAPEHLRYRTRGVRSVEWHVTLVVDVSGSMEASVIYSALVASILAGLPALSVRFVAFSTEVVDLSDRVDDPLGLLLEVSVGGGTNIGQGLRYARDQLTVPSRSLVVLVSDFEEGQSVGLLLGEVRALVGTGATALGLAALDDRGQPAFNRAVAEQVAGAGMPVAALTPLELVRWIGEQVRR